jgi:transcriptional regulator with XRE-family HTH domain
MRRNLSGIRMDKAHEQLVENVQRLLKERGWSQRELGRRMKMAPGQLGQYLLGNSVPTLTVLCRFADAFGVTPANLITGPDASPRRDSLREAIRLLQALDQGVDSPVLQEFFGVKVPPPKK